MMIRPILLVTAFLALASCGTQNSSGITGCRSAALVGEDDPRSCANVIDQPSEKTFGDPESLEWFTDKRNTKVNQIIYFKNKYCKTSKPDTTSMDQKRRAKVLSKWREDQWDCAKKKHEQKRRYWLAYLDGQIDAQNAASNQNGLDWLDKWQKDYNDKLDSIVKDYNARTSRNGNGSYEQNYCRSQGYNGGYADAFGKITCHY